MTDDFISIDETEYVNELNNSDCESENESYSNNEKEDDNEYYIKSDGINITYIKKENFWNPNFNLNSNHDYSISSDEENNFIENPKYNIFQNSLVKSPKYNDYVFKNLINSPEDNNYSLIESQENDNHILNLQNNLIKYSDSEDSFHSFLKNYNNYEIDDKNIKNKNDDEIIINNIIKKIKNNYS